MVNYKQFEKTKDVAFNILNALEYCKKTGEDGLVFEKGVYHVKSEKASETFFSVSNHSDPGLKRICFLLENFENFILDGGESEFIFDDILFPVAISKSKNVTVKNFTFSSLNTLNAQAEVVASGDNWFEMRMETNLPYYVYGADLYVGDRQGVHEKLCIFDEVDKKTGWLVPHAADTFFDKPDSKIDFSETGKGTIRAEGKGVDRKIQPGNKLVFMSRTRCVSNIFINQSENTTISNVTLYSGIGMGIIAQNSDTISVDHFSTRTRNGRYYSINADGTHFVHCKGKISIRDCYFEGQLDDALNVHSIYLKIVDKTERSLILKFMHPEARGIQIVDKDAILQISNAETLIPYHQFTVQEVRKINLDYMEVVLDGTTETVKVGDVADEISWKPEVCFENCIVRNNRARGMLLASAGKTVIRNNLFQTPGSAIKFESDGKYWYESGGTKDVLITGNTFDHCKYALWGTAVIEMQPRERTEVDKYFHGKVEISGNEFKNCDSLLASLNNTEHVIFQNNQMTNCTGDMIKTDHCKETEIQSK